MAKTSESRSQQLGSLSAEPSLSVLVVDDSRLQRRLLGSNLENWGYRYFEACSGTEALQICRENSVDLVLSDWVMPGMDGLTFCREFRALARENYGYFILLTSKDSKDEIARGLDVGADDFLTKPVNAGELRARLQAGERVLEMQQQLVDKNRAISKTLEELQTLYQAIDRDLEEAKKLQHSLLPQTCHEYPTARISMLLRSSGHIGGDMVGLYYRSEQRIGLFAFDVSGHGVSSALMTARFAGYLNHSDPAHSIATKRQKNGLFLPRPPVEIATRLNDRLMADLDTDLYLTILLADIDLTTGEVDFVQAGHPHPAILHPDGAVTYIGGGGLPIGLFAQAEYDAYPCKLMPGDRLVIHSDGFTEAENCAGEFLDAAGFAAILTRNSKSGGPEMLADIVWETQEFSGGGEMADDLSVILLEFDGDQRPS